MAERWQVVGKELGLEFPAHIGRAALPLFDTEREDGLTVVETGYGRSVGVLLRESAGRIPLGILTASVLPITGRLVIERHVPPTTGPGSSLADCSLVEAYDNGDVCEAPAEQTARGAVLWGASTRGFFGELHVLTHTDAANDFFSPAVREVAAAALNGELAGHTFDISVSHALRQWQG